MIEEWREIPTHPGYEVSSLGSIRSVDRWIENSKGHRRFYPGKVLKLSKQPSGYRFLGGRGVNFLALHRAVADAFIPNPGGLPIVRHLDDNKANNRVENLAWGTYSDNSFDNVLNGGNHEANKTHCPKGHPYDETNTQVSHLKTGVTRRACKICMRNHNEKYQASKGSLSPGDTRHGTYTGYSNWGCRCDPCRKAKQDYRKGVQL